MKKTIKLLLLAALAWPSLALAQGQPASASPTPPNMEVKNAMCPTVRQGDGENQARPVTKTNGVPSAFTSNLPAAAPQKAPVRDTYEVVVADGNRTNSNIPVYGLWSTV